MGGATGTHLHCVSNLDILALEFAFSHKNTALLSTAGAHGITYVPVVAYGDTREAPPVDWRSMGATTISDAPSPEPSPSGPEQVRSQIHFPTHRSSVKRAAFSGISGTASGTGDEDSEIQVAVARRVTDEKCAWWNVDTERFVRRSCDRPVWNVAAGSTAWELPIEATFRKGAHVALSRFVSVDQEEPCCEPGRNLVRFRLK